MELGVNHPRGPAAWCRELGVAHVVAVLGALHRELGEERYRIAPLLARAAALGRDPFA
jgi:3-hydroxybutyryl-CoA dehydrogenase